MGRYSIKYDDDSANPFPNWVAAIIVILLATATAAIIIFGCNGNRDEDYIRGVRQIKESAKHYWDSVNKLSKQPKK